MINTILTPDEAKSARAAIRLSQVKVAQGCGISRTKLALFEVKKYFLSDYELNSLKQFYVDQGVRFEQSTSPGIRLIDGYAIPENISSDYAEKLLAQIADHDARIQEVSNELAGVSWLSGDVKMKRRDNLFRLMARNYHLVRLLQGRAPITGTALPKDKDLELVTNGELFNQFIHGSTNV